MRTPEEQAAYEQGARDAVKAIAEGDLEIVLLGRSRPIMCGCWAYGELEHIDYATIPDLTAAVLSHLNANK